MEDLLCLEIVRLIQNFFLLNELSKARALPSRKCSIKAPENAKTFAYMSLIKSKWLGPYTAHYVAIIDILKNGNNRNICTSLQKPRRLPWPLPFFPPLFLALEHPPNGNANVHYAMYASPLKNAECIFFWCVWGARMAQPAPTK